jgi:hypothetical protein
LYCISPLKKYLFKLSVVVHTYNSNTQEP